MNDRHRVLVSPCRHLATCRKTIAKKLHALQVSQRAAADMLGINEVTIARDLGKNRGTTNVAKPPKGSKKNQEVASEGATYVTPPAKPSGEEIAAAAKLAAG